VGRVKATRSYKENRALALVTYVLKAIFMIAKYSQQLGRCCIVASAAEADTLKTKKGLNQPPA
jgi:hypothetical protein